MTSHKKDRDIHGLFWQNMLKERTIAGGTFSYCINWHSTSYFITALQGTKEVSIWWLDIKVEMINHCPLLYGGHTKETELMLAQRYLEQNIKNNNIRIQPLAWKQFQAPYQNNIKAISTSLSIKHKRITMSVSKQLLIKRHFLTIYGLDPYKKITIECPPMTWFKASNGESSF